MDNSRIPVAFFQRLPRPGFNFSMEAIFEDVRQRLADRIEATVFISGKFNDGVRSKFFNVWEAGKREIKGVNHITGEVHFLNLLMNARRVILTIHDCRFMDRKAGSYFQSVMMKWLYLKGPVRKAAVVTTVSHTTRADIIRYTNCDPEKIVVIPVGISDKFRPAPKVFNTKRPDILQIGTGDNKNLERLVRALKDIPCHLTIIGKLSAEQEKELLQSGVEYTNQYNLSQSEVVTAYENCDMLAFVSLFEGFGMPIIEANSVERVVLTSNISSMPEVAADAALLVDPYKVEDIRRGVLRLIADGSLRQKLIDNGRRNRKRFQPENIAQQYYELYQMVGQS
ncbi:glycosyltransferase family 4 protein [Neolewinella agarilytica]|uniref:Glycosyltransferase involved in cell wall bisynthesis n=1 Tax=Neolewinella agarilytica TaxID=478744 RepID=A0A1H9GN33_9BACT|nr:glycosyltransferase family 1 protein [Neolewinella agarilytica]SEQ51515.1 Glycosyltransferase involved in cell wall bisynthesis [Neolewinella agarilytica]